MDKFERGKRIEAGIYETAACQDEDCGYIDDALQKFGINTKENDQYRPVYEVMRDIAKLLRFQREHMDSKEFEIFKYSLMQTLVGIRYCNEFMCF